MSFRKQETSPAAMPEPTGEAEPNRYLMRSSLSIGAAVFALSGIEQILEDSPGAEVDMLCTPLQGELLSDDPRISRLFPVLETCPKGTPLWKKLRASNATTPNLQELRARNYEAVFRCNITPLFDTSLNAKVVWPRPIAFANDIRRLKKLEDRPMGYLIRKTINQYFGVKGDVRVDEKTALYLRPEWMQHALEAVRGLTSASSEPENRKLIVVCPDSSSSFTRPQTPLLAQGIAGALEQDRNATVLVFPSFSSDASERLTHALREHSERVHELPADPTPHLLYEAALMDLADVVISPDTSTLHLAAAKKILTYEAEISNSAPRNNSHIIALFGATNPGLFSYPFVTTLGRGRKEQRAIQPGIYKLGVAPDPDVDYLSHISPNELTAAILNTRRNKPGMASQTKD